MTRSSKKARPVAIGGFAPKSVAPSKPQLVRQTRDLSKLRAIAMRLARHLEKMMPKPEDARCEAPSSKAERNGEAESGKSPETTETLPPAYQRLLGRGEGVIASFDTLVHLVIRLLEKEREPRDPSQDPFAFTESDEQELDRRIVAELDRLASRRDTAGSA